MKRLLIACLLASSCATGGALRALQVSHSSLALAQDLEAQLCWGVADVRSGPTDQAARLHCTTPVAAKIGLTDQRHQDINKQFVLAFQADALATKTVKAGGTPDLTTVSQAIQFIAGLMGGLDKTNATVVQANKAVADAAKGVGK